MKSNFSGRRYKCLICYDFDLCAECQESGQSRNNHSPNHAVQCILTRSDHELFYGSEAVSPEHPQSLACPFCRQLGFTDSSLHEHVASEHTHAHAEVICPVCAATPHGDPNRMTEDLASHLAMEHVSRRDTTHEESRAPRRLPHGSMRSGGGQLSRGSHRGRGGGSQATGHLAFARESASASDPITELLTQLGGMRRASTNYSSTLQQIQQLQQQLGRGGGARRAIVMPGGVRERGGSSTGEGPYGDLWWDEIASATGGRPAAIILEDGQPAAAVSVSTAAAIKEELRNRAAASAIPVTSGTSLASVSGSPQGDGGAKHLLTKLQEESLSEDARAAQEAEMGERSAFVEELFLSTLRKGFLSFSDEAKTSSQEVKKTDEKKASPNGSGDSGGRKSHSRNKQRAVVQPSPVRALGGSSPNPIQSVTVNYGVGTDRGGSGGGRPTARVNPSASPSPVSSSVVIVQNHPVTTAVSAVLSPTTTNTRVVSNSNGNPSPASQAVHPLGNHNANHGDGPPPSRPLQPVNQQIGVSGRAARGRGRGIRASENTPAL